ncbi:MAG: hypothetical protein LBV50_01530 [Novosphingobium sp.]|jgi:hypothetical protein|nr:hypothetical protein [Novosphingobium sp.]
MRRTASRIVGILSLLAAGTPHAAYARNIDFGDDASQFAKDGECDDMRFAGAGMTDTLLIDSDIGHDATDCRTAYNQDRLTYNGGHRTRTGSGYAASGVDHIMWGDDASRFANDGECDDKRFVGPGMTGTRLLDSDIKHDRTDCRTAYQQGRLRLRQ